MSKTILEVLGTLFLVCMLVQQDLIAFEERTEQKVRRIVNHMEHQIYCTVQDIKAIRRACKRQEITARDFLRMLCI